MDASEGYLVNEDGADGIENNLECAEEGFTKDRIEKYGFEGCGEVCVKAIDA